MAEWQVHWLEVQGWLAPWRSAITVEIGAGRAAMSRLVVGGIPEIGMLGPASSLSE